jgi:hypothetical protein
MAIEDEDGATALNRIGQIAALQKQTDLDKLKGVLTISSATLEALNTQLIAELKVINSSEMAEAKKEEARQIAFGKYNAAITAAGELADKASYTERVQIQLTEIARLASLSKTSNAALVLAKLRESEELNMIDRVAAAQKRADDARLKALQDYIALLGKVGPSAAGSAGGSSSGAPKLFPATSPLIPGIDFNPGQNKDRNYDLLNPPVLNPNAGVTYNPTQNRDRNYDITINAGVISQPEEFAGLIQDTIQRLNRGGDPLTTAGVL